MGEMIARCGFQCGLCMIYRDNLKDEQDRIRFRDILRKYYGDEVTLEQCYCDGCMTDDNENPARINTECKIRPCVIEKGLDNCAYCDHYPCSMLERAMIDYGEVEKRYGAPIPREDYESIIKPYESRKVLDSIRQRIK